MLKKRYIEITNIQMVESIMYMLDVVKGDDICMVYDGSKSGLNDSLWAPWFALPTIHTMTCSCWITYVSIVDHPIGIDTVNVSCLRFLLLLPRINQGVILTATRMDCNAHTRWFGAGQLPSTSITSTSSRRKDGEEIDIYGGSSPAQTGRLC